MVPFSLSTSSIVAGDHSARCVARVQTAAYGISEINCRYTINYGWNSELTQSAGTGSCKVDGYVQGNVHRVDNTIFERNPSFLFVILKSNVWGQVSV
jgi:hypothetical protein